MNTLPLVETQKRILTTSLGLCGWLHFLIPVGQYSAIIKGCQLECKIAGLHARNLTSFSTVHNLFIGHTGTSYTMTMVEQASNRSTATNYGLEVTDYKNPSIPLHSHYPEGPYWQGSQKHTLPESYILTKTHCGGRCVRCGAPQYAVNASAFLDACARTTARLGKTRRSLDNRMDPHRVHKVVHLLRNPFTNIVARFHLESRNLFRREQRTGKWLPKNATGLRNFCQILDEFYAPDERDVLDADVIKLMADVPCRAEFYKWTMWHNRLGQVLPAMGPNTSSQRTNFPVLTLYYEDYHAHLNVTAGRVLDFLELEPRVLPYRAFRELPSYADHFSAQDRQAAWRLIEALATPWTWERIRRYRQEEDF